MPDKKESELVISILNLHNKILKKFGGTLSVHGIGISEYLVLNKLMSAPNQKMRRIDLAEQVGMSPSGITRLINPMEKTGLVDKEENPRDARVSLVTITTAGIKIYEEASISFTHASAVLFEHFTAKQTGELSRLLKILS